MNLALMELLDCIDEIYAEGGIGDVKLKIAEMIRRSEACKAGRKIKGFNLSKED